jgi:hypothetical protein
MNLLAETRRTLAEHGIHPAEVDWVGTADRWTTWEDFAAHADRKYDAGFGAQEVGVDLLVVGPDWWLERHEYDGSEWWEFKSPPRKPDRRGQIADLIPDLWCDVVWQEDES